MKHYKVVCAGNRGGRRYAWARGGQILANLRLVRVLRNLFPVLNGARGVCCVVDP